MNAVAKTENHSHGWLDSVAVGMSLLCAVHCLITPVLLVMMPVIATTFWVHQDFHLWLLFLVLPTTGIAFFLGCRKHKDKLVMSLGAVGLALLIAVAFYESFLHAGLQPTGHENCPHCLGKQEGSFLNTAIMINVAGGALLVTGHVRNFLLCRKERCQHDSTETAGE